MNGSFHLFCMFLLPSGFCSCMFLSHSFLSNTQVQIAAYIRPLVWIWRQLIVSLAEQIPRKYRVPMTAILVVTVILTGTFSSPELSENNYRNRAISMAGLFVFYASLYATSTTRHLIVWRTVLAGLLSQYILALFVLRTQVGYSIFNFISMLAR